MPVPLDELQRRFAQAVFDADNGAPAFAVTRPERAAERIAIYRRAVFNNYRNALAATYPVIRRLVGPAFFNTAVDNYARVHPSASGDLNIYGGGFSDFLAGYAHAASLPYLRDVAHLEWAADESIRAAETTHAPDAIVATLSATPPDRLEALRLRLDPSCRLVASAFPILRIWQVNQPDYEGSMDVAFDRGGDKLLVRREGDRVSIERIAAGEFAWLSALAEGASLGAAIEAAQRADAAFDFTVLLRTHLGAGTIAGVVVD